MPLHGIQEDDLRKHCKDAIEALELWLRRGIHECLSERYGDDYFSATNAGGDNIINNSIRKAVEQRMNDRPGRYSRPVDALELKEAIAIVCKPVLYKQFFKPMMRPAFPQGCAVAREFLTRLVEPRNKLYHANPISIRESEQVLCYSHDVIDSIRQYFESKGLGRNFNVPTILSITDWTGEIHYRSAGIQDHGPRGLLNLQHKVLRPGDRISLEAKIDPSFSPDSYHVMWPRQGRQNESRLSLTLGYADIAQLLFLKCYVKTDKSWHRFKHCDDELTVYITVLPPIEDS